MKVNNILDINRWLDSIKMDKEIEEVITELTDKVFSESQSAVHIDSGDLKASGSKSVKKEGDKIIGNVSYDAPYAAFEEFGGGKKFKVVSSDLKDYAYSFYVDGSGRNPAHPFLTPSYRKNRRKIKDMIEKKINEKSR